MQTSFEQAIEVVKSLPNEDLARFDDWFEKEKRKKNQEKEKEKRPKFNQERYAKARKWLEENSKTYMNQWVCLFGDKLISHGTDALEVHRKAKEVGIESPFLHHIVEEEKFFVGGWI